jgi:hypothetical protein
VVAVTQGFNGGGEAAFREAVRAPKKIAPTEAMAAAAETDECRQRCDADPQCTAYVGDATRGCLLASGAQPRCPAAIAQGGAMRLRERGGWELAVHRDTGALLLTQDQRKEEHVEQDVHLRGLSDCTFAIGLCARGDVDCSCDGADPKDTCRYVTTTCTFDLGLGAADEAAWWRALPDPADPQRVNIRLAGACRYLAPDGAVLPVPPDRAGECPPPHERVSWSLVHGAAA